MMNKKSLWQMLKYAVFSVSAGVIQTVSFILFYNVPGFIQSDKGMLFIYMLLMYILTGTLDSLVNANYGSLFIELFKNRSAFISVWQAVKTRRILLKWHVSHSVGCVNRESSYSVLYHHFFYCIQNSFLLIFL